MSRQPQPAAANGGEPAAAESQGKRRCSRRHADDDFGDFTYLHDPSETEPGIPGSRGAADYRIALAERRCSDAT